VAKQRNALVEELDKKLREAALFLIRRKKVKPEMRSPIIWSVLPLTREGGILSSVACLEIAPSVSGASIEKLAVGTVTTETEAIAGPWVAILRAVWISP
jgi:hypothetical protein